MKRKLTLMTLLLMMVVGLWAQNTTQRLVVWQKSGEKVYFDLNEMPETTFAPPMDAHTSPVTFVWMSTVTMACASESVYSIVTVGPVWLNMTFSARGNAKSGAADSARALAANSVFMDIPFLLKISE